MKNSKDFPLGDILSFTTGEKVERAFLLADGGIVALRDLISHMTDEQMLTDSAMKLLAPKCREGLLEQHPGLLEAVEPPTGVSLQTWVESLSEQFGKCLSVTPI
jgi:hypothetical protein